MRFAVCYKRSREESARRVKRVLEGEGEVVYFKPSDESSEISNVDLIVVVGGDGTVIRCAKAAMEGIPLVGVKAGRLGFLSSYTLDNMEEFAEDLKTWSFIRDERWFLSIKSEIGQFLALNDVVVQKDIEGRMLEIEVIIGGGSPLWFFADGLIVSSPTGSTAYNLSAGGPVVHPACETLQLTPLLPHFLFNRGIVVPASSGVNLILDDEANILIDGKIVGKTREVRIGRSTKSITIFRSSNSDFFKVLKTRIGYGRRLI